MNSTGQQTRRNKATPRRPSDPGQATPRPGAPKATWQAKIPPGRTWLWLLGILLANYLLMKFFLRARTRRSQCPILFSKRRSPTATSRRSTARARSSRAASRSPVTYPPAGEKSAAPGGHVLKNATARGATPGGTPKTVSNFTTTLPSFVDHGLETFLIENGVEISAKPIEEEGNALLTLLFGFGPALLFIGFYVWMFRRAAQQGGGMGGLMGIGRSKARRYDQEKDTRVTFDDVAGIDEAENELVEIVDFLRDPKKYTRRAGPLRKACC